MAIDIVHSSNELSLYILQYIFKFVLCLFIYCQKSFFLYLEVLSSAFIIFIQNNKMKLHLSEVNQATKIKMPPFSVSSHRVEPVKISFNREGTPIKSTAQKFKKQSQKDYEQLIRSPFQTEKFIGETATSKQHRSTQSKSNVNLPLSPNYLPTQLLNQKRKNYTQHNNGEDSQQFLKSSQALQLRQTVTYVQQILSDLADKGNYGLAKRYAKKLNQANIRRQMEKLILKMEGTDLQREIQLQKIRQFLSKILLDFAYFNFSGNCESLSTEQLLKQVSAVITKAIGHMRQQELRENENNLMLKQLQREKIKMKESFDCMNRQNIEKDCRLKNQLQKSQRLEGELRQNVTIRVQYQNIFSNINQEQKTFRTEWERLKGQNVRLATLNKQIQNHLASLSYNSQLQRITVKNLKAQLDNMRAINQRFISQASRLRSINLKLNRYTGRQSKQSEQFEQSLAQSQIKKVKDSSQFKQNIKALEATISSIEERLNFIANQIQHKRDQFNKISAVNKTLQMQIQANEAKLKGYEQAVQKNSQQLAQYQRQLRQIKMIVEGYIKKKQDTNSHIKSLNDVAQQLDGVILEKKGMLKNIKIETNAADERSSVVQIQLKNMQKQIDIKDKQLKITTQKIHQNTKLLLDVEVKIQEKKANHQIKIQQCKKYQLRLSKLMKNCKTSSDLLDQIQLDTIRHSQLKETLLKEQKILDNQITSKKKTINDLKLQHSKIENQVNIEGSNLRSILNQIQQKRNQLQKQQTILSTNLLRASSVTQQIETKTNTINKLKEMEQQTFVHIQQIKGQLAQCQLKCKQVEIYKEQASELYHTKEILFKQILEKQQIIQVQKRSIKDNQELLIRFQSLLSGVAELQQQNQEASIIMNRNIMQIDKQNLQLQKLKQQSEFVAVELMEKKKQLQANSFFVQQLLINVEKLSQHMNFWQKEVQRLQKQQEQLSFDVLNKQRQISNLQIQITKRTHQKHLKQQKLGQVELLYQKAKEQYKQLKQNVRRQKYALNKKIKRSLMTTACEDDIQKLCQNAFKDDSIKQQLDSLLIRKKNTQSQISRLNQVLAVLQADIWRKQNQLYLILQRKQTHSESFMKHVSFPKQS